MRSNRAPNTDVICTSFERLARSHESLLVVRLRPAWTNPLNGDFDFVSKLCAQFFDFVRTCHDSICSLFGAQSGEAQDLLIDFGGDSDFAQRFFGRTCQNSHTKE